MWRSINSFRLIRTASTPQLSVLPRPALCISTAHTCAPAASLDHLWRLLVFISVSRSLCRESIFRTARTEKKKMQNGTFRVRSIWGNLCHINTLNPGHLCRSLAKPRCDLSTSRRDVLLSERAPARFLFFLDTGRQKLFIWQCLPREEGYRVARTQMRDTGC